MRVVELWKSSFEVQNHSYATFLSLHLVVRKIKMDLEPASAPPDWLRVAEVQNPNFEGLHFHMRTMYSMYGTKFDRYPAEDVFLHKDNLQQWKAALNK